MKFKQLKDAIITELLNRYPPIANVKCD